MHKVCWIFLGWIFLCKLVFAQSPELNQLITVSFEQASPDLALQKIEDASGIPFSYNNNLLPNKKISFSFKEKPLRKVLDKVLGELKLGYSYKNGILIIIPGRKTTRNNYFTVSGYIEDVESGERLIGATVYDARTRKGTITNEFGFFSLRLQKDSIVLVASMVGYAVHAEKMFLNEDHKGFIHLKTDLSLETVEINDDQYQVKSELGGISAVQVPISDLKKLP